MRPLLGPSREEVRHACAGDVSSHGALQSAGASISLRAPQAPASILACPVAVGRIRELCELRKRRGKLRKFSKRRAPF